MTSQTPDELRRIIADAQKSLSAIQYQERRRAHERLIGKCYKFRNSYSCPEKESDYWWLYRKITSMDEFGWLNTFEFQKDRSGQITIREENLKVAESSEDIPISHAEFNEAWDALRKHIDQIR